VTTFAFYGKIYKHFRGSKTGAFAWQISALLGVVTTVVRNMKFYPESKKIQHSHLWSDIIFFIQKRFKNMLDQGFGHLW
jgi:hypothetical protein